jgi:hypothetical protein
MVAFFTNISDAKIALGQLKKEYWNQANLAAVYAIPVQSDFERNRYEFAMEEFGMPLNDSESLWPGVKESEISDGGKVCLGATPGSYDAVIKLLESDTSIKDELPGKVITILDTEPENHPRFRLVLESNGGEVILDRHCRI